MIQYDKIVAEYCKSAGLSFTSHRKALANLVTRNLVVASALDFVSNSFGVVVLELLPTVLVAATVWRDSVAWLSCNPGQVALVAVASAG